MARKHLPPEGDVARLKTKIAERSASSEKPGGISALRSLCKRLKRAQRKIRARASRRARGEGKKTESKAATAT
jgi:hypothetical protein